MLDSKKKGNILWIENGANLKKSFFDFRGSNSIVVIRKSKDPIFISIQIYDSSIIYVGNNIGTNQKLNIIAGGSKNVIIGDNCLFGYNSLIRTSDGHQIYDLKTKKMINAPKSVYIYNDVWIGQDTNILKGTVINSGSIIGCNSVISNKYINHNELWAGNPGKRIKKNVSFSRNSTHFNVTNLAPKNIICFENSALYETISKSISELNGSEKKLEILLKFFTK